MKTSYPGFAYRQTADSRAPWLVLTVIPAEELLKWAGVPRRTESSTMGFQRVEDEDRVRRTTAFFNLPPNQSPTALIVGVHPPVGRKPLVSLAMGDAHGDGGVRACILTVDFDQSTLTLDAAVELVRDQLKARLGPSMSSDAIDDEEEEAAIVADADDAAELASSDDDDVEPGIELAHSLLGRVLKQLDNPAWVAENQAAILDMAKPATIIDGQHRLLGAALCERNIPFGVCVLVDCPWPEQVFQFTVVNYSAKGIPDQFITANAALSLTQDELGDLQARLTQASVKVVEYDLMRVVQFDPESAFYEMVNLTESRDQSKIGYKTMVRVAKEWYNASHPVLKNMLLPALLPEIVGVRKHAQRVDLWKEELWGKFFIDFWRTIRDSYQGEKTPDGQSLWTVPSQLLVAIVLFEFQRQFFQDLSGQDEEYFEVPAGEDPVAFLRGKLRTRATKFVTYFPPGFFASTWGTKSLSISSGRKALQTALAKLRETRGKYQYARSALVTGETG
jgi:hypothetical protein